MDLETHTKAKLQSGLTGIWRNITECVCMDGILVIHPYPLYAASHSFQLVGDDAFTHHMRNVIDAAVC